MGSGHWGWMVGGSNLMIYHRSIHFSRPGEGTNSWTGGMMSQTEPCFLRGQHFFVLSFIIHQKYQEMTKNV